MSDSTNDRGQTTPSMEQEPKKVGLPKPPLFTTDYITMAEILQFAMERFGQLVLALMYYTADGTMPDDLSPDLKMMFGIYQRKVDAALEKYKKKCATNAENGSKGGKAKAENSKKKTTGAKFTPPTQKQFRDAVKHFADCGDIDEDTSDYDRDAFFDQLEESGWAIKNRPIQCRSDWEYAIRAKFFNFNVSSISHLYYSVFSAIFSDFCPDGGESGGEWADNTTYAFFDTYDENSKCWIVQGENFPANQWKTALAKFMTQDGAE